VNDDVMDLLPAARVLVIIIAPHTTQFAQLLDPTVFGIFKREKKYHLRFDDRAAITSFVDSALMKMNMTKILPFSNRAAALQAIIVEFNMIITLSQAIFHQGKLKESQR
jgi:hypothetical protein